MISYFLTELVLLRCAWEREFRFLIIPCFRWRDNRGRRSSVMKTLPILIFVFSIFGIIANIAYSERLPSYMYSISYNSVRSEIDNPKTHEGLYPDTVEWSKGGEVKYGLQALIACNKKNREYLVSEIIGVRSGIRNVSDSIVQLWFAFYSPDKHMIPPDYTLFIEGTRNYRGWGPYLGDDVGYAGPRKRVENMVSITPGKIFNPSIDSLFYNTSDGLFSFDIPGTYKLWFTISYDSLTSNLSIPLTKITSDTIELQVIEPKLIQANELIKLLPKKIPGYKSVKPGIRNNNIRWNDSLRYPEVWRSFYSRGKGGDSSTVGITIIDSGQMPEVLDRESLCKQIDIPLTTVKGFPACKNSWDRREKRLVSEAITVIVGKRIIVNIQGRGVGMEKLEKIADLIDYSAIEKAIKPH